MHDAASILEHLRSGDADRVEEALACAPSHGLDPERGIDLLRRLVRRLSVPYELGLEWRRRLRAGERLTTRRWAAELFAALPGLAAAIEWRADAADTRACWLIEYLVDGVEEDPRVSDLEGWPAPAEEMEGLAAAVEILGREGLDEELPPLLPDLDGLDAEAQLSHLNGLIGSVGELTGEADDAYLGAIPEMYADYVDFSDLDFVVGWSARAPLHDCGQAIFIRRGG